MFDVLTVSDDRIRSVNALSGFLQNQEEKRELLHQGKTTEKISEFQL